MILGFHSDTVKEKILSFYSPKNIEKLKKHPDKKNNVTVSTYTRSYYERDEKGVQIRKRKALKEVYSQTKHQCCWVHKTMNILNKLPKFLQEKAKAAIHTIWMAETKEDAEKAFDLFVQKYNAKYPKATQCLIKNRKELLTFYDFPAQHCHHLRASNSIESMFSTIRLRTYRTKGYLSRKPGLTMGYQFAMAAQARWPRFR